MIPSASDLIKKKIHSTPLLSQALESAQSSTFFTCATFYIFWRGLANNLNFHPAKWKEIIIFLSNPGQLILVQPLPELVSDQFVCMEMIDYHRFTMEVIGSFNCRTERRFSVVLLNNLGRWESLQGTEPLMFADHPFDVLSLFYRVLFPALFTRLFLMHLRSENVKVV